MRNTLLCICLAALCLTGCKNTGRTLTSATGSIYEVLIVVNNSEWESEIGDSIRKYMEADMPCMPQMEPMFKISQIAPALFDDLFKPARNLLIIDINPEKYTQNKITYAQDYYSTPQAVCRIQSPSAEELATMIGDYSQAAQKYFIKQELNRQGKFYQSFSNKETRKALNKRFGCDMLIPSDYQLIMDTTDFLWAVNDNGSMRRDVVVYSYPYTDPNTFTYNYLLHKRDSVMHRYIQGSIEGTYAGTEYKQIPPVFSPIAVQKNAYAAEIRGLWKMYGGMSMGGPFVQHTRLDEINQRVITAEVFLFAPGQRKRNALRQAEAILYTLQLPQEINAMDEIVVVAPAKE